MLTITAMKTWTSTLNMLWTVDVDCTPMLYVSTCPNIEIHLFTVILLELDYFLQDHWWLYKKSVPTINDLCIAAVERVGQ